MLCEQHPNIQIVLCIMGEKICLQMQKQVKMKIKENASCCICFIRMVYKNMKWKGKKLNERELE